MNKSAAGRLFGIDRKTVAKILKHSVPPGYRREGPPPRPKLDPFIPVIDQILEDDKRVIKKQRRLLHTVYPRIGVRGMDVVAQRFLVTQLSDRHQAEVLDLGGVEAGEIRLGDRVYGRYRDLAAVGAAGADYVVRLSARALKLESAAGRFLNRAEVCRRAEAEGLQDLPVRIRGAKAAPLLAARLIVLPLPPEQAEAARRVMKKKARKWGYTPSQDALACAGCLMLITSLPFPAPGAPAWPAETVLALYRRRWQVELAFKRLKSLLRLEALRAFDPGLVSAWGSTPSPGLRPGHACWLLC